MMLDRHGGEAVPKARSECPGCGGQLIAKCGQIITWHWAHKNADFDPWSEPESEWHLGWKRHFRDHRGANIEVVMPPHRADIVTRGGQVIELQSSFLNVESIHDREAFYGPSMMWLYRCTWIDRLQFGDRGFWWKNGSQAMCQHNRTVWWDMCDELWRIELNVVDHVTHDYGTHTWIDEISGDERSEQFTDTCKRVLGRVLERKPSPLVATP